MKREVYLIPILVFFAIYQYIQINNSLFPSQSNYNEYSASSLPQVELRDSHGNIVSRKSNSLSEYFERTEDSSNQTTTASHNFHDDEVQKDREEIITLLKDAGITDMSQSEIQMLPTSQQIQNLYYGNNEKGGRKPAIVGLETCPQFRQQGSMSSVADKFIGVSGMFNSGTTAFGLSLQANCKFDHHSRNYTNGKLIDVDGMLDQVPWAKHKNARERAQHTIHDGIPKENVLPIVLVRDPYYWMQSMCKQGYGARWDHIANKHCPNLVPNDFDKKRFKRLKNATSVLVWMGKSREVGPNWDSLAHLWNDWYSSYVYEATTFPRLIIRFEDTLFYGKEVMKTVCECAGAKLTSPSKFRYVVDEAKFDHKSAKQNNMISAIIRYGTDTNRYHNMTNDDLQYAYQTLDPKLMDLFQYKIYKK